MKKFSLLTILFFCTNFYGLFAQNAIEVTDQTIKIGANSEVNLYFSFAEGDQIIFNFSETEGKGIKEISVFEYPSNLKFSDYKVLQTENKTIDVSKNAVYKFHFVNSNLLSGRICHVKIFRIPSNEQTKNFSTSVKWIDKPDTVWKNVTKDIVAGYDTTYTSTTEKKLVKIDTIFIPLYDKTLRVASKLAIGKKSHVTDSISLPINSYYPNKNNPYKTTELIGWSYWIGVGEKSVESYNKINSTIAAGIKVVGSLAGYPALATLVSTGVSLFSKPSDGDNVIYNIYYINKKKKITLDSGDIIAAAGRNYNLKQGIFYFDLKNDNITDGINVSIKIVGMQIQRSWEDIKNKNIKISPRYETRTVKEAKISTVKIPILDTNI